MKKDALLNVERPLGQGLALRIRRQLHGRPDDQPGDGARHAAPQARDALLEIDLAKRGGGALMSMLQERRAMVSGIMHTGGILRHWVGLPKLHLVATFGPHNARLLLRLDKVKGASKEGGNGARKPACASGATEWARENEGKLKTATVGQCKRAEHTGKNILMQVQLRAARVTADGVANIIVAAEAGAVHGSCNVAGHA